MRDEVLFQVLEVQAFLGKDTLSIPAAEIESYNRIVAHNPTAAIKLGAHELALRLGKTQSGAWSHSYKINMSADDFQVDIYVQASFIETLYDERVDFSAASDGLIKLLLHHALRDLVLSLERFIEAPVTVIIHDHVEKPAQVLFPMELCLRNRSEVWHVYAGGNCDQIKRLLPLCELSADTRSGPRISFQVCVGSRPALLPRSEVSQLLVGDLLFLKQADLSDFFVLSHGDAELATVSVSGDICSITQLLESNPMKNLSRSPKAQSRRPASGSQTDSSNVLLTVELGNAELSLQQAQALREGMVLDLGTLDTENVTLRINSNAVATGTLLTVGDGVGLQINAIFPDGE